MGTESTSPSTTNVAPPHSSLPLLHRFYIILKAHYFLFYSAFGIIYPILNITLRSRGLSNTELSYFNIGIPFLVFVTNPLLNYVADLSRRYRLTYNVVLALATISCIALFIVPPVKSHRIQADLVYDQQLGRVLDFCASQEVATKCASRTECGCAYQADCTFADTTTGNRGQPMKIFFPFSMTSTNVQKEVKDIAATREQRPCGLEYRVPVDRAIRQYQLERNSTRENFYLNRSPIVNSPTRLATCEITCSIAHYCHGPRYSGQTRYVLLYSILFVLSANFLFNAMPLGIAVGFASLHRADIFGKQRVWGTIGFGISAFSASRVYQIFQTEFVYVIMFAIASVLCILVTSFVRIQPDRRKRHPTVDELVAQDDGEPVKKKPPSRPATIISLLKRLDVIVFLALAFAWGMSYAALDPFLYLYIDELAPCQSRSVVGYMSLIASIAEVIALFFAEKVLKLLGTNLASVVILLAYAVRFGGYYYIRQPYLLTIMETMHFFNFGILYVLIIQKANAIAPPNLSGTVQSLTLGVTFGLARGVGLILSSFIYTMLEQRLLFLIFAVFNLICAVVFGLYFLLTAQRAKKSTGHANGTQTIVESDVKANEEPLLTLPAGNPF